MDQFAFWVSSDQSNCTAAFCADVSVARKASAASATALVAVVAAVGAVVLDGDDDAVGVVAVVSGLYGSLQFDTPSGPSIVVAALVLFVLSLVPVRIRSETLSQGGGI